MSFSHTLRVLCGLSLCLLISFSAFAADEWRPIDPGELALKAPTVDKDADAEALFWEVKLDDSGDRQLVFNHYVRIKVFTERGRESQSKIDLAYGRLYGSEIRIQDIAARTVKADGTIVELKKDDVFERTIVKASGVKVKARSFAMPAVEPGCIIEYRWKEVRLNQSAMYVRLQMQREIPVQQVKYLLKPYPFPGLAFRSITFHERGPGAIIRKEKDGFVSFSMADMPAVYEEARMPPEDEVKTWVLIYYSTDEKLEPDKYWVSFAKRFYDDTKSLFKANDEVKQMAASLVADAKSDDEKIERLFEFCRTKIKNISGDASGLTPDDRKKLKDNKSPSDTLKRQVGTSGDIDLLFGALVSAAGFDARIVLAPDRSDMFFDKGVADKYFVQPSNIGVNVGGTWKFFNPGYNYIPFGMLRWQEEGQPALVTDSKQPIWVDIPVSSHEKTRVKRTGKLKLGSDGTLEGDVKIEYSGHFAIERKQENDHESEAQREELLKEEVKARLSTGEISNIKIENVTDHVKPFTYSFHIRVPAYAQKTGRRLFLQPAFFQYGTRALFATTGRKYPIHFHYPWSEEDEVEIALPEGFALDNADAPAPFQSTGITEYRPRLSVTSDGRTLVYHRKFYFGGGGAINFPVTSYPQVKALFDNLHQQDSHSLALKQTAESKP